MQENARLTRKELTQKNKTLIRKQKTTRVIIVILLSSVILYITGIYGASLAYFGDFLSNISVYFAVGDGWPLEGEFSKALQVETTDNALCLVSEDYLKVYSPTAKEVQSYNHAMQTPIIDTSGSRILLYNPKQTSFKVLHSDEVIFNQEVGEKITHGTISKDNTIAITSESESYKGQVVVYDYSLEQQFVWNCSKGYPVYSVISDNGDYLMPVVLNSEDGNILSDIYIINVNEYTEEFIISHTEYPLNIDITNTNKAIITYTNHISAFDIKEQKELYSFNIENKNILISKFSNPYILAVFGSYETLEQSSVVLLDETLTPLMQIEVSEEIKDTLLVNQRVYILSQEFIYEYNLQGELLNKTQANPNQKLLIDYQGALVLASDSITEIEKTN